jgi:4-amino-4-deoxy-L-arabinose transferase-like glycosyltransferase
MRVNDSSERLWPIGLDLILIGVILWLLYFARLGALPLCGEEPRRAEVAREMVRSGDFVVPRQQGQIYCSRPPLQNWLIALTATMRGSWDAWSVRLPSALATSLLVFGVYWYALAAIGRVLAIAAAVVLATMGQMMHIGGMGETDPLFALLLGGSLLIWHGCLVFAGRPFLGWTFGGLLAGLSGLAKGAQGPISFWLVVGAWLLFSLLRGRETLRHFLWAPLGILACLGVLAAWTIPYYLATDLGRTWEIWFGQIESRLGTAKFPAHLLTRPLETLACWLPWTPLLVPFLSRKFWNELADREKKTAQFCLVALAATFPTVWLVPEARNRYFLGLYPAAAILVGLAVHQASRTPILSLVGRIWEQFLRISAVIAGILAGVGFLAVILAYLLSLAVPWHPLDLLGYAAATLLLWVVVFGAGAETIPKKFELPWEERLPRNAAASVALGGVVGFAHLTFVHSFWVSMAHDPGPQIAAVRGILPHPEQLVSFGPVFHRFRYYYGLPIRLLPWPADASTVPPEITYFCVEGVLTRPKPTPADLLRGLWRVSTFSGPPDPSLPQFFTAGRGFPEQSFEAGRLELPELPFDWEVVAVVPCGRNKTETTQPAVVVGRIVRGAGIARGSSDIGLY